MRRLVYVGGACYHPSGLYPEVLGGASSQDSDELDDPRWRQAYERVAPDPGAWPRLVQRITQMDRSFAGWSPDDLKSLNAPVLLIIGDSDIVRPEHTVDMFRLLGGGVMAEVSGFSESRLASCLELHTWGFWTARSGCCQWSPSSSRPRCPSASSRAKLQAPRRLITPPAQVLTTRCDGAAPHAGCEAKNTNRAETRS